MKCPELRVTQVSNHLFVEDGGPATTIVNDCAWLAAHGVSVRILGVTGATSLHGTQLSIDGENIVRHVFPALPPRKAGVSLGCFGRTWDMSMEDVVHIRGVWHIGPAIAFARAKRSGVPIIWQPMGGYSAYELDRKPVRKMLFRYLFQDRMLRAADLLHVNSLNEAEFLRSIGIDTPALILPVGVEQPLLGSEARGRTHAVYLGRIHPTKGIEELLHAWAQARPRRSDWVLTIAGTGDSDFVSRVSSLLCSLGLQNSVRMLGFVDRATKWRLLRQASVYILPSRQENFGNSVAEAMSAGAPVLTTTATPWSCLENERAGWICAPDTGALSHAIKTIMRESPSTLAEYGENARRLALSHFTHDAVMQKLLDVYKELAHLRQAKRGTN